MSQLQDLRIDEPGGDAKLMTNAQLIHCCVQLEQSQKQGKTLMNRYKAELQARGLKEMEDHNTRYVKYYGEDGSAAIADSMSLDILNPNKLKACIGDGLYAVKIKENVKKDYKCDPKLERALKAIFTGDYTFEFTLEEFLTSQMAPKPTPEQQRLLLKKLKGDYEKDGETLTSVLGLQREQTPSLEVELWYIYRIKNAELIKAFLPEEGIDATIAAIRKCIMVESKTAITIDYDAEEERVNGSNE